MWTSVIELTDWSETSLLANTQEAYLRGVVILEFLSHLLMNKLEGLGQHLEWKGGTYDTTMGAPNT